jgi:hypothetical protein
LLPAALRRASGPAGRSSKSKCTGIVKIRVLTVRLIYFSFQLHDVDPAILTNDHLGRQPRACWLTLVRKTRTASP